MEQGAVWTTEYVVVLIHKQFGVHYHPAHMSRLLKAIKYSVQQPIERSSQRNEKALQTWKALLDIAFLASCNNSM